MKIREDFLPLSRPSIGDREIDGVVECLKSGWITTGPACKAFEDKFRELTGASHAVSLSSATAGMHLVLLALGIGEGDEIITPSMTFASTVNMIVMLGARPVFVDIRHDTLNMNPELLEKKISPKTKAIIPVHFAGAPVDMDRILEIADRYNLTVIEDAAHAVGTYYKGVHAGGFGHIAIFSFHPIKNITSGEGGMITHSDEKLEKLSEYNIGYGLHFPACHLLQYIKNQFGNGEGMLPETERAAGKIISLPLFPDMADDDVSYVCEAIKGILKS